MLLQKSRSSTSGKTHTCDSSRASLYQPESVRATFAQGRFRSGQTGQTVNLLALRLRWFESSPAQILFYRRRFVRRLPERGFAPRRAFDTEPRFREPPDLARPVLAVEPRRAPREIAGRLTRLLVRERLAAAAEPRRDFLARPALRDGLGVDRFLGEGALLRRFVLTGRGIPMASRAVVEIGLPVAAAFPARAPTAPPTTAPIGPATLPTTAPVAAPIAGLEIGGIVMFSLPCSCFGLEFSVDSSGIAVPRFACLRVHRMISAL